MAIRTAAQVISSAITYIQSVVPGLSLLTGTVARDVVVEAPAQEFGLVWTELDRVQRQQLLSDSTAYTDRELTMLAASVGIVRSPGIAATGVVTFRLSAFSTASSNIPIPLGTEVATATNISNNTIVTFNTSVAQTFVAANANTYFNPQSGFYELTVPITASTVGPLGNVAANTIVVLVNTIAGSPSVVNLLPTAGGTDQETNAALLSRVQTKLAGTAAGTPAGILSVVNANPSVINALLIQPGDTSLVRNQYGNAADVDVIGETLAPISETLTFSSGVTNYILSNQPISSDAAVNGIIVGRAGGTTFNFIKGTHYSVVVDNNSLTVGSTRAVTSILFLGSPFPDAGTTFTVSYSYNGLIPALQSMLSGDLTKIIGTDILVRAATRVLVKVGAFIVIFPGYTKSDVAAAATTNVANLLNGSKLNQSIDQSDIIATIRNTPGVDSVNVPVSIQVKRPTDVAFIPAPSIIVGRTEYARPDVSAGSIQIT